MNHPSESEAGMITPDPHYTGKNAQIAPLDMQPAQCHNVRIPKTVKEIMDVAQSLDTFTYMRRAFSEENRPAYHSNEDRFFCEEHVKTSGTDLVDMFIVGVIDGHDGAKAAEVCAEKLPSSVFSECFIKNRTIHEAHKSALEGVEKQLANSNSNSGCCINSCVGWGRWLWCANLGDCRALYIPLNTKFETPEKLEHGAFCWMSKDLKASARDEQERITKAGGKIQDGRVEGLEPTRTIGDFDVKKKVPKGVISIIPETRVIDILEESQKIDPSTTLAQGILIQCSDGIWDSVTGIEILNIIRSKAKAVSALQKYLATAGALFNAEDNCASVLDRLAGDVVRFALSKGTSDDCTAVLTLMCVKVKSS